MLITPGARGPKLCNILEFCLLNRPLKHLSIVYDMDATGLLWEVGLPTLPSCFVQWVIDTPAPYNDMAFLPNGILLRCMIFNHSLIELKPADKVWVRCMICWLRGSASWGAKCLMTIEHLCMRHPKDFRAMLMRLYQAPHKNSLGMGS